MTNKNKERVLTGLRTLMSGLQTAEMPAELLEKGRALPFYEQAVSEPNPERAFLALYNAYGTLLGFRPGLAAMADDLGAEARLVRSILARIRRDEGDAENTEEIGPRPTGKQLEALKSGLRRRFLAQI